MENLDTILDVISQVKQVDLATLKSRYQAEYGSVETGVLMQLERCWANHDEAKARMMAKTHDPLVKRAIELDLHDPILWVLYGGD